MGKRSLKASLVGIAKAKQAFQRREWTQEYLASAVGLQTRQPIWKFFSGRPIERYLFIDICFQLDLEWEEIAEFPKFDDCATEDVDQILPQATDDSTTLVWFEQMRSHVAPSIQRQCNTVHNLLHQTSTLTLSQIYTDIYLLPHLLSQRWLEVEDLQSTECFNRDLGVRIGASQSPTLSVQKVAIGDAIARHPRLMILGKPGAGKTTTLQYLALQCSAGQLQGDRIPVFGVLRDWADQLRDDSFQLESYLHHLWAAEGLLVEHLQTALHEGKIWLFLDGLDEVPPDLREPLQRHIQRWVDTYPHLPITLTCRLAAQDYHFQGFAYMEVADFEPAQITTFVQKWFLAANPYHPDMGSDRAQQFLDQLQKRENQPIRELAITPILLHLTCLVFQERGAFPKKRTRLYQHGLDILLVQWDAMRGIHRSTAHAPLTLSDRFNILSQLAATLFEQGRYFFEKTDVLAVIVEYLETLPNHSSDAETLWLEGEAILQSIVLHHGLLVERAQDVYSFSHLTFQEYLTARKFFTQSLTKSSHSGVYSLERLASHVADPRWQDVIALTLEQVPNARPLLVQLERQTDALVSQEPTLQLILQWAHRKASQIHSFHHPIAVRAFYLSLVTTHSLDLALALDTTLTFDLNPELALDWELSHLLLRAYELQQQPQVETALSLRLAFDVAQRFSLNPQLKQSLQTVLRPLLEAIASSATFQPWWSEHGEHWVDHLQQTLIQHRDIGHRWSLTAVQQQQLHQYYRTTLFLLTCCQESMRPLSVPSIPDRRPAPVGFLCWSS